jgi:hypothetical protein
MILASSSNVLGLKLVKLEPGYYEDKMDFKILKYRSGQHFEPYLMFHLIL